MNDFAALPALVRRRILGILAAAAVLLGAGLYGCAVQDGPPSSPGLAATSGTDTVGIPDDFPLDVDHRDLTGDGGELLGPGPDVRGLAEEQVCASDLWKVPAADRLAFVSTGPEYADVRELRTFATTADALAQMEERRASFAGCDREVREGTTILWTTYEEDTGYDSVTFSSTVEDSLGGGVFQVTRVGRAVLALVVGAEWSEGTAPGGAAELTAVTRRIAPEMCLFTEAGCGS